MVTERIARDYPERSTALLRGFGGRLDRAALAGGVASALSAGVVAVAVRVVVQPYLAPLVAAVVGALVGVAVARLAVPAPLLQAFEAFSWLGRAEVDRFEARTGGKVPIRRSDQERWLDTHPASSAFRLPRIEMLAFVGRLDEARAELEKVVETEPDLAFERATLAQYVDWLTDGNPRLEALRASAAELPLDAPARQAAMAGIAVADARDRFMRGDADWSRPLRDVRPSLGRAASRVVWRDTWLRLGMIYLVLAFAVGAFTFLLSPLA
jgi:hypothetical protein